MLRFEWSEARAIIPGRPIENRGHGYFLVTRDANGLLSLNGEWGYDEDEVGAGRWTAVMQERESPTDCYNSIRRTAPASGAPASDEIRFSDEGTPPPPSSSP